MKRYVSSATKLEDHGTISYKGTQFRFYEGSISDIVDHVIDLPASQMSRQIIKEYKAQVVTKGGSYDLSEYYWADISDGYIKYTYNGEVKNKVQIVETIIMDSDVAGLEGQELAEAVNDKIFAWVDDLVDKVMIDLNNLNQNIQREIDRT